MISKAGKTWSIPASEREAFFQEKYRTGKKDPFYTKGATYVQAMMGLNNIAHYDVVIVGSNLLLSTVLATKLCRHGAKVLVSPTDSLITTDFYYESVKSAAFRAVISSTVNQAVEGENLKEWAEDYFHVLSAQYQACLQHEVTIDLLPRQYDLMCFLERENDCVFASRKRKVTPQPVAIKNNYERALASASTTFMSHLSELKFASFGENYISTKKVILTSQSGLFDSTVADNNLHYNSSKILPLAGAKSIPSPENHELNIAVDAFMYLQDTVSEIKENL